MSVTQNLILPKKVPKKKLNASALLEDEN